MDVSALELDDVAEEVGFTEVTDELVITDDVADDVALEEEEDGKLGTAELLEEHPTSLKVYGDPETLLTFTDTAAV